MKIKIGWFNSKYPLAIVAALILTISAATMQGCEGFGQQVNESVAVGKAALDQTENALADEVAKGDAADQEKIADMQRAIAFLKQAIAKAELVVDEQGEVSWEHAATTAGGLLPFPFNIAAFVGIPLIVNIFRNRQTAQKSAEEAVAKVKAAIENAAMPQASEELTDKQLGENVVVAIDASMLNADASTPLKL